MTTFAAPPIDASTATRFSDEELEEELTLASLTTAREANFNVLFAERQRRRQGATIDGSRASLLRRVAGSFASRDGVLD